MQKFNNPFEKIISTCHFVCEHAKDVHINYEVLDKLLEEKIPCGKYWGESNLFHFMDLDIATIVNFLLLYQSIGFSFWGEPKWTIATDEGKLDGSTALMYIFIKNIDFFKDFKKVEEIQYDTFKDLMQGNIEIPLLEERYHILKEISHIVNEKMNGDFYLTIKEITDDINLCSFILANFPSFKDTRTYQNKEIYFYKLASLLTSDILHVRSIKEQIDVDYSHIAGCSDYKIPQILHNLNITEYSKSLEKKILNKEEIPENDPLEIEIRASVIEVEKYIADKTGICGIDANDYLWLKSKNTTQSKPYHLTRTKSY